MNWKWGAVIIVWMGLTVLFILSLLPYPAADGVRAFSSEEELIDWLSRDRTDDKTDINCCYDFADKLVFNAQLQGYALNIEILNDAEYEYYYDSNNTKLNSENWQGYYHAVVSARIGNQVYLIEPQTDEVWFYADLIGDIDA